MINVKISVSTNASEEEKKKLHIPREAIDDFLGEGFASNTYEGDISFKCKPRTIDSSLMDVILEIKDNIELGIALATAIRALINFFKKCSGYEQTMVIYYKKKDEKFELEVPVDKNSNVEKILKEIRKIIK